MYAVIKAGGKQQKVKAGDVIEVELMHTDSDKVEIHPILVVDDEGKTHVGKEAQKAVVVAKLVGEQKGEKVHIFKYRAKTGYAKRQGHRQRYTLVEIEDISVGASPAKRAARKSSSKEARPVRADEIEGAIPGADEATVDEDGSPETVSEEEGL